MQVQKPYLLNLGMALNYEMKNTGVNVTVVLPGPTKTPGLLEKPAIPLHTLPAPQMKPDNGCKDRASSTDQKQTFRDCRDDEPCDGKYGCADR